MKKRIADILRRVAARLDPPAIRHPVVEAVTPLEFMTNKELAEELGARSDRCILYFGQLRTDADGDPCFAGSQLFKVADAEEASETVEWMINDLMTELRNRASK